MTDMTDELFARASDYCKLTQSSIVANPALGHGTDGSVWRTTKATAVKAFIYEKNYRDELECYRRLKKNNISDIIGLAVPEFEDSHDHLMIIEMSIVQKPYLLDFGKVYIDRSPPYYNDKQLIANWHAEVRDLFEEQAPKVHSVLYRLRKLGIYYVDPKPANIRFE